MKQTANQELVSIADVIRGANATTTVRYKNTYDVECLDSEGNVKWKDKIENLVVNVGLDDVLDKYFKGSTYTAAHYVGLFTEVGTAAITGATVATPGVISTGSTTGLTNGDVVRINNVVGMTELNGNEYVISSLIADTSFEIPTTAGFTAYTSGGDWWEDPVIAADTMASHASWTEAVPYSDGTRPSFNNTAAVSAQSLTNSANKAVFNINASATVGGCFVSTDSTKSGSSGTLFGGGVFTQGSKPVTNGDTLNVTLTFSTSSV